MNLDAINSNLIQSLPENIRVIRKTESTMIVETPFLFPDGDYYQIFLQTDRGESSIVITDLGHTFQHISYYDSDIKKYNKGSRYSIIESVVKDFDLEKKGGEIRMISEIGTISSDILRFSQALTKIFDLTFLSRSRVRSTFLEDLEEELFTFLPTDRVVKNYSVPEIPNSKNYPVDYNIKSLRKDPVFLFGVSSKDKAKVTTIIIQHFQSLSVSFKPFIVFEDEDRVVGVDRDRLLDVAPTYVIGAKSSSLRSALSEITN